MSASSSGQVLCGMPWYVLNCTFLKPEEEQLLLIHLLGRLEQCVSWVHPQPP